MVRGGLKKSFRVFLYESDPVKKKRRHSFEISMPQMNFWNSAPVDILFIF